MSCRLTLESVAYRYRGGKQALHALDLELGPGVVGLLGPNGAGKSTLMRIIATLARPSAGRVSWNGVDIARTPDRLRAELGYLPQDFGVYQALDAAEFLRFLAAVKGLPAAQIEARVADCLARVGLAEVGRRRLGEFSGGMRQRVGIAQALLNDPRLLIVDEPTVGLDPEERMRFRHLLAELAGDRLVLLSTHIVSDVESSAGRLAVLADGRLLYDGTPEGLVAAAEGRVWDWCIEPARLAEVRAAHRISSAQRRSDGVRVRVVGERAPAGDAVAVAPDLESAYVWCLAQARQPIELPA